MRPHHWILCLIVLCIAAAPPATQVGQVRAKALNEASGLIASRKHGGLYWTHNDGDVGVLYAVAADGSDLGKVKIDAKFRDWEDIAADAEGNLYLADVGNNERQRKRLTVYRIAEPDPAKTHTADVDAEWRLTFPDRPFNCESLFVHEGYGYVISKVDAGEHATVYRFRLGDAKQQTLETVCELPITEPVTAADLSANGRRLAVLSQHALNLFTIDGDVRKAAEATPQKIGIPPLQLEGCCFNADGVLMIAESGEIVQVKLDDVKPATTTATTQPNR